METIEQMGLLDFVLVSVTELVSIKGNLQGPQHGIVGKGTQGENYPGLADFPCSPLFYTAVDFRKSGAIGGGQAFDCIGNSNIYGMSGFIETARSLEST